MAIVRSGQTIGICVHHSVYQAAKNLTELKAHAVKFNEWHKAKSWAETTKTPSAYPYISYHYLMALDGSILKVTDEKYVKYHAGDNFRGVDSFNLHGIAICIDGNYETRVPNDAQMKALVLFIRDVERRYKINANVRGHKETTHPDSPTACPGKNIGTSKSGWLKQVIVNCNDKNYPPVVVPPIPPVEPPVDPELIELRKKVIDLTKENETLKSDKVDLNQIIIAQKGTIDEWIEKYDEQQKLLAEANGFRKYQKLYMDAVKDLNDYKKGRFMWVVEFLEKVFPKKD